MLVGAVMGFWAVQRTGSLLARDPASPRSRARRWPLIHAFLVVTLRANQIVSGLALTIFAGAAGLSSYLGNDLNLADSAGAALVRAVPAALLADGGRRRADPLQAVGARLCVVGAACCSSRCTSTARGPASTCAPSASRPPRPTRWGSTSPRTATRTRSPAARSPASAARASRSRSRRSGSTASRPGAGWIAIALVIFAFWRPTLCLVGAYLFGAFSGIPFTFQARGILERHPARALPGAAVRDDDRRAGARLERRRAPAARRAGRARHAVRARRALEPRREEEAHRRARAGARLRRRARRRRDAPARRRSRARGRCLRPWS